MCTRGRQGGLSLVELIVFVAIVGVGLAGILGVLNVTARASADPVRPKQALAIAEAILEEAQYAAFTHCDPDDANFASAANGAACASLPEAPGPEAGDARPYDNVSDYHDAAPAAVTDVAGTPVAALAGYRYTVEVADASLGPAGAAVAPGDAARITVTVTGPDGERVSLQGWRTRYAPNSPP